VVCGGGIEAAAGYVPGLRGQIEDSKAEERSNNMNLNAKEIEKVYRESASDAFMIYSQGMFYASVCSSLGDEETTTKMQSLPCGTIQGWTPSKNEKFASGELNPSPCNDQPDTHKHYLFNI